MKSGSTVIFYMTTYSEKSLVEIERNRKVNCVLSTKHAWLKKERLKVGPVVMLGWFLLLQLHMT